MAPIWDIERENGPPGWARRGKERAGEKVLGRGERRKRKGEGGGLGLKGERDRRDSFVFLFFLKKGFKHIQFKFKLKEFEFKFNHKHLKQCKVAWMHNNKTTSFNFIKPTNHYLFLLNSL